MKQHWNESYQIPAWKRILDIACIVVALPVLVPVTLLISALIWFASPGPILYLNERVGYLGRKFICFKFRTMKVNADVGVHQKHLADLMKSDTPMTKMDCKGDPRVIPFGGFLRATGLDELPQLLNVIGGQMSIVGPRPCLPYEYDNYVPAQKRRFNSLPGLTGLWQVSGKNKTTFSEMIALDIHYTETMSPWLDLKIMFKTIPALLGQVIETKLAKSSKAGVPQLVPATTPARIGSSVAVRPELVGQK